MSIDSTKLEFQWSVRAIHNVFAELSGICLRDYYTDANAYAKIYSLKNRNLIKDIFGDDVNTTPYAPAILYGQLSAFGFELLFPENGEVSYQRKSNTIDEAIQLLSHDKDYIKDGYYPTYKSNLQKIRELLPEDDIIMQYSTEGPTTFAFEIMNQNFFYQPYDDPEKLKILLERITDSIIKFRRFQLKERGYVGKVTDIGLYDDLAAMLPPELWDDFVLPFWNTFYKLLCKNKRFIHCEGMNEKHLYLLEKIGITYYEPSISPKLNPRIIKDNVSIPFSWKLESFHYPAMSLTDIRDWVFQAVADGADRVWTDIGANMLNGDCINKVNEFIRASKAVDDLIEKGANRQDIQNMVSNEGRKKFWKNMPW